MKKLRFTLLFLALVLTASIALSCGTSSSTFLPCGASSQKPAQGEGQLQSITLSPASADAQNCPNGVQFTPTGHYIDPPQTVTPQSTYWAVCQKNAPTTDVSVTTAGVAQCASGASDAYSINGFVPGNCEAVNACGTGCTIYGTAQLTCP
ncbi:MAG: hypothetical protein ABSA80_12140 [Terriglobales bacterium]|jgi:hypothetical protein